ncbi:Hint domain-containing protein [Streptomyces sp. UNOB3_S3]|uniref:Hint domain-containing protein n=1 Tax=Streptomyces sp. UNOB3_S3 TaxID=2871682 RepID=UPI0027E25516|nr:Hint domain-containing protein [Streptomyces sp. UNOB3_S3]
MGKLLDESADAKKLVNESEGVLKKFQEGAICPISNKPKKNSFIPETPVLMADGTRKPIKDVLTGQQILATDPETGATAARVVTNVITGEGRKHLVEITIAKGGEAGNAVGKVTATAAHPFWVENQHRWRDAEELKAGDRLRTPDGELNEVIGSRAWTETRKVYNLTVDGLHTYYVLAGAVPVLVHNSSWCTEEDRFEDAADIATGHANSKHATEFPGVSTSDLTKLTQDTMKNPSRTKDLGGGRKAYLGKDGTTVVIHDPMHQDGGTVFRREPTTLDDYWQGLN